MNLMTKLLALFVLSALPCMSANAYVSVRIGPPVLYSAPTYSYGCGHVGEPPCQYYNGYTYPTVSVPLPGLYFDPWFYYDRGPRYYHHHRGYGPAPRHHHYHGHGPQMMRHGFAPHHRGGFGRHGGHGHGGWHR